MESTTAFSHSLGRTETVARRARTSVVEVQQFITHLRVTPLKSLSSSQLTGLDE